jgi:hypothetical protein
MFKYILVMENQSDHAGKKAPYKYLIPINFNRHSIMTSHFTINRLIVGLKASSLAIAKSISGWMKDQTNG